MTRITDLVGIKYPIFQGGMAWVADWHIAAAVSEAGGLGIIGVGGADENWLRDQIKKCREATDKPFGVNLMLMNPRAPEIAKVIAEEKVKVVTTGAGSPEKYMDMWKEAGIIVIPVVAGVALAKRMQQCGADAVIAEGTESGGHIGEATTMTLVPQVVDAVSIPVIAAGGIADGRGAAAAIALGAEGVEMSTIFMAATDAPVHPNVKQAVLDCGDMDTVITGMCTGEPCRQIKNKLSDELLKIEAENVRAVCGPKVQESCMSSVRKAMAEGDMENGAVMAGQIAALITEQKTVAEIIDGVIAEAKEVLAKISGFEF